MVGPTKRQIRIPILGPGQGRELSPEERVEFARAMTDPAAREREADALARLVRANEVYAGGPLMPMALSDLEALKAMLAGPDPNPFPIPPRGPKPVEDEPDGDPSIAEAADLGRALRQRDLAIANALLKGVTDQITGDAPAAAPLGIFTAPAPTVTLPAPPTRPTPGPFTLGAAPGQVVTTVLNLEATVRSFGGTLRAVRELTVRAGYQVPIPKVGESLWLNAPNVQSGDPAIAGDVIDVIHRPPPKRPDFETVSWTVYVEIECDATELPATMVGDVLVRDGWAVEHVDEPPGP